MNVFFIIAIFYREASTRTHTHTHQRPPPHSVPIKTEMRVLYCFPIYIYGMYIYNYK